MSAGPMTWPRPTHESALVADSNKPPLTIIPARGGSKGLPGKNLLPLAGKPLIAWTIEAARTARQAGRVIVSTDSPEIASVARDFGAEVPFLRPAHLATDEASTMDVVFHAMQACGDHDSVLLLQPTSPLRQPQDIDGAIDFCQGLGAPACLSVYKAVESPYLMLTKDIGHFARPVVPRNRNSVRRQDQPQVYVINGAIYFASARWLREHRSFLGDQTVLYEMPRSRSIDIDTAEDFDACIQALAHQTGRSSPVASISAMPGRPGAR